MASLLDHLIARIALTHARSVYARFERSLRNARRVQRAALDGALDVVRGGKYGRAFGLHAVRTPDELRRAIPLQTYEDIRPYVQRVAEGEIDALLSPGHRPLMFATSSGTTAQTKLIPVTAAFVREYRRGWNTFGLKMLTDHRAAMMRHILQVSGRMDERPTPAGIPCGAITGLMARTQKRIVRRFYVGAPEIPLIDDPQNRYYALMRFAIARDVAFAVTANPATLIRLAQVADAHAEELIRDIADGTLSRERIPDEGLRRALERRLRPDRERARALEALHGRHGALRPRDYWRIEFLACWTGGSMGHYRQRLRDWYGERPVRDVGLLASEGRVSIPLKDETAAGVLDVQAAYFEFIPMQRWHSAAPETVGMEELVEGGEYAVVLTNHAGLVRYRLDDVVRVVGRLGEAPVVEFLYRAGGVSSVAGEKLTENQLVAAVETARKRLKIQEFDFIAAPCWDDPPFYRLTCAGVVPDGLGEAVDAALCEQNDEYGSRRKSIRLNRLQVRTVDADAIQRLDRAEIARRGCTAEQYKRVCLFSQPGADDAALGIHI